MTTVRPLSRDELELIWTIDRSEIIENVCHMENGGLVLRPERYDMDGWPPGEAEGWMPRFLDCFDRGGWFCGIFDREQLVAVAVLESRLIGKPRDQLQLVFLHVGSAHRGRGFGKQLFEMARTRARTIGARRLYVSATPSERTVGFYLGLGCVLAREPDPELLAREPEDIHLECTTG